MPPKRSPPQEQSAARKSKANTVATQELSSLGRKKDAQMQDAMDRFAAELNRSSDDEDNILEGRWSELTFISIRLIHQSLPAIFLFT